MKMNRRQLLSGAPALAVGASIPAQGQTSSGRNTLRTDVCVVGAGFAGLSAALQLKKAGLDVVVLEARNRTGGRSLSGQLKGGGWVDLGAQWAGPSQDRFYALIREMGAETYPSPNFGKALQRGFFDRAEMLRIEDEVKGEFPGSGFLKQAFGKLDIIASGIDPERPWAHAQAAALDSLSFANWLEQNIPNENVRAMVGAEVSSIACASPEEISTLAITHLIRACGGIPALFLGEGGAQQDRIIGGTQTIATRMAARLGKAIRPGEPVRRIQWRASGAIVHTDKLTMSARKVIICVPPSLAGAIEYEPALPVNRTQITQRWPQGLVIKIQMIYDEPFWRADGLNGASLDYLTAVGETADGGVPEKYSKKGILTGFIYSGQARKAAMLSAQERKQMVLAEMAQKFGPKALTPVDYHEMNWTTQQWTRGGFTGFLSPGATTMFGSTVRDSVGPLHWAGSENATVWPSFIEGAISSGEREAGAIIKAG